MHDDPMSCNQSSFGCKYENNWHGGLCKPKEEVTRLFDADMPKMMKSTSGVAALAGGVLVFVMVIAGVAGAVMRFRRPSLRAFELDEEASADSGHE